MKNIRPFYCIIVVFILGVLGGAFATHLYDKSQMDSRWGRRGENREERLVNRLDRELDLTAAQKAQVKGIVHETLEDIKMIRRQYRPQMDAVIEKSRTRINVLLTTEQQKKLEGMVAKWKERRRQRDN
jgi:Spy/CpxP family protein refolding chaperone